MYHKWMEENNKSVYEASIHFNVSVKEIWEQIKCQQQIKK